VSEVHVIFPEGIDDPARPSGGNTYDRKVCLGLGALGWTVREHPVPGAWPRPDEVAHTSLVGTLRRIPDGEVVLLDGLIASAAPEALLPHARRLRQVVVVHMPLGGHPPEPEPRARGHAALDRAAAARERDALGGAAAVITTSGWTRDRLLALYGPPSDRVHVAEPGVDAAEPATGSAAGNALLCIAAVTRGKGHDVLLDALATARDLSWLCACVGSLDRDPAFADRVRRRAWARGLGDRIRFTGPRTGPELERAYAAADVLVLPSRAETYGMVVTEALARGVPVVASDVGGVSEALGHGKDSGRPGLLVPPGDPVALGAALRRWLEDPKLRARLRRTARERRESLRPWATTAADVAAVLRAAATDADFVRPLVAGAAR